MANYLTTQNVNSQRFRTEGYGEEEPVATNDTAAGRAQNRRVELYILPKA